MALKEVNNIILIRMSFIPTKIATASSLEFKICFWSSQNQENQEPLPNEELDFHSNGVWERSKFQNNFLKPGCSTRCCGKKRLRLVCMRFLIWKSLFGKWNHQEVVHMWIGKFRMITQSVVNKNERWWALRTEECFLAHTLAAENHVNRMSSSKHLIKSWISLVKTY